MTVLTTRMIHGEDKDGNVLDVIVTIFTPFHVDAWTWKCAYSFDPPVTKTDVLGNNVDYLSALQQCLKLARVFLEYASPTRRGHWQGLRDFGLPSHEERPASYMPVKIPPLDPIRDDAQVLATRGLGCPDENGVEREVTLSVFTPYEAAEATWRCGFTFEVLPVPAVVYGTGADFIEALLDALSLARLVFESKIPKGWVMTLNLLDCADFPYKIGRSYRTDPSRMGRDGRPILEGFQPES